MLVIISSRALLEDTTKKRYGINGDDRPCSIKTAKERFRKFIKGLHQSPSPQHHPVPMNPPLLEESPIANSAHLDKDLWLHLMQLTNRCNLGPVNWRDD